MDAGLLVGGGVRAPGAVVAATVGAGLGVEVAAIAADPEAGCGGLGAADQPGGTGSRAEVDPADVSAAQVPGAEAVVVHEPGGGGVGGVPGEGARHGIATTTTLVMPFIHRGRVAHDLRGHLLERHHVQQLIGVGEPGRAAGRAGTGRCPG